MLSRKHLGFYRYNNPDFYEIRSVIRRSNLNLNHLQIGVDSIFFLIALYLLFHNVFEMEIFQSHNLQNQWHFADYVFCRFL